MKAIVASQCIEGFEDYIVYFSGKVFSLKSDRYLKSFINVKGYHRVGLCKAGKQRFKSVARLVAEAFIPNPDNKPQVNHKDTNKDNNRADNLEWATSNENMQHAADMGRLPHLQRNAANRRMPIEVYEYNTGVFKSTHSSITDAAKHYNVDISHLSKILRGERKHTKGLTFKKHESINIQ